MEEGDTVSMHYDPMIAKLVVWGENRDAALVKLKDCLFKFQVYGALTWWCAFFFYPVSCKHFMYLTFGCSLSITNITVWQVAGLPTNVNFLQKLSNHWAFESGQVETHFIEHFKSDLFVDSTDTISEETSSAAKLGASLAAACVCRQEQITMKDNFNGNRDEVFNHIYIYIYILSFLISIFCFGNSTSNFLIA